VTPESVPTGWSDAHEELRAVARRLLDPLSPLKTGGDPGAPDRRILADAGWLGLEVPEVAGGAGATFAETAVILEELGRAAAAGEAAGGIGLGVGALSALTPVEGIDRALSEVAAGALTVAVALPAGDEAVGGTTTPQFRATGDAGRSGPGPGALRVHGRAEFVMDGPAADAILLVVSGPGGAPGGLLLAPDTPGLTIGDQPVLDPSRRFGVVEADGVEARNGLLPFEGDPFTALSRLLDRAAAAVACDSLGLAAAALDATVSYAGVRQQFGRPIGSFQAVKHACADMLVDLTVGRELLRAAVDGVASGEGGGVVSGEGLAGGGSDGGAVAVSQAKSQICEAAVRITGHAMQLHGGIGYTWERGLHVYLKRAALNRSLFGSPAAHRRRLARRYHA
jgi:alkylation response protein AidB-like acyl-CoA dehydrogenase